MHRFVDGVNDKMFAGFDDPCPQEGEGHAMTTADRLGPLDSAPLVRRGTLADAEAINSLFQRRPWVAPDALTIELSTPQPAIWVVDGHPGVLAVLWANLAGDWVDVIELAVAPSARRSGLGRMLMVALQKEAHALGKRGVTLEVAADNHAALALYRACGFRQTHVRPGYYRNGRVDALVLSSTACSVDP